MKTSELKKEIESGKIHFGKKKAIKLLLKKLADKIFLTHNFKSADEIKKLAKIMKVEIIQLKINSEELSEICKKPFKINVITKEK